MLGTCSTGTSDMDGDLINTGGGGGVNTYINTYLAIYIYMYTLTALHSH